MRMGVVAAAAGVLVLAACGGNTGVPPGASPEPTFMLRLTEGPATPEPTVSPSPSSGRYPPVAVASGVVRFTPCRLAPAKPKASNLGGRLTVERVMELPLPEGWLGSGAAYDAAYAGTQPVAVADDDAVADVFFGMSGAGVAFVELRLSGEKPVSWVSAPGLNIVTDGGDGGFFSGAAGPGPENPDFNDYIDAFEQGVTPPASNACVLRRNEDQARPTGFLFHTGIGDGRYPTYLGRNAKGEVVTVLNDGLLVPWAEAGLPGRPPPDSAN